MAPDAEKHYDGLINQSIEKRCQLLSVPVIDHQLAEVKILSDLREQITLTNIKTVHTLGLLAL